MLKKDEIIRAAQSRFADEYEGRFRSDNYRGFSELPVNNAYLELFRLYYSGGDYLRDLYARSGGNLPAFIAAAKRLKGKGDPREELTKNLGLTGDDR
jgi:predicted aminopeptidase